MALWFYGLNLKNDDDDELDGLSIGQYTLKKKTIIHYIAQIGLDIDDNNPINYLNNLLIDFNFEAKTTGSVLESAWMIFIQTSTTAIR